MTYDYSFGINLGDLVAEQDQDYLHTNFVDVPIDDVLRSSESNIIIGRKGSGKSALRLHFEKVHTNDKRILSLCPKHDDFFLLYDFITQPGQPNNLIRHAQRIWEFMFLMSTTSMVLRDQQIGLNADDKDCHLALREYEKLLGRTTQYKDRGEIISLFHTIKVIRKLEIDFFDLRSICDDLRMEIEDALNGHGAEYYFVIDSIDDTLSSDVDITDKNNEFSVFFEGLISFFRDHINSDNRKIVDNIHLKLLIPKDIFSISADRHHDHLVGHVHELRWGSDQLDRFISKRLRSNLSGKKSQVEQKGVWSYFLPDCHPLKYFDGRYKERVIDCQLRNHILNMTLGRPRDLMSIFDKIVNETAQDGAKFPDTKHISSALAKYSETLRTSVEKEYQSIFPEIGIVLGGFASNSSILTKDALINAIESAVGKKDDQYHKRCVHILFDANIVGAVEERPAKTLLGTSQRALYRSDFDNIDTIWNFDKFEIHCAFHESLRVFPELALER